jgi:putative membrane protein
MRKTKLFQAGFMMGLAELIPGISATTIAFLFGIYQPLIEKLQSFRIKQPFNRSILAFVLPLGLGMVVSLLFFSHLFQRLLQDPITRTYAYCFFWGCCIRGVFLMRSFLIAWRWHHLFYVLGGLFLFISLFWLKDHFHLSHQMHRGLDIYVILFGILAMAAALIPGISGCYILFIAGLYPKTIHSLSHLLYLDIGSFFFLGNLSLGLLVGLILFTKVFSRLFLRYKEPLFSFFTGCLLASLYFLWPYSSSLHKAFGDVAPLLTNQQFVYSFLFFLLGTFVIARVSNRQKADLSFVE